MTWHDCDGKQLSIGDPVTLVGPIAGRTALGMHKHGEILGFGRIYVYVRIDDGTGYKVAERVSVRPDDVRYGHHGYPRTEDRLQVLVLIALKPTSSKSFVSDRSAAS
jgi:hypothetical protein